MTLIELITVMVLVAILTAIGIPSFRSVTTSSRMSSESNALLGDLQYARAEAAHEGEAVTVCIANAGATGCNTGSTSWQNGWLVFSDINDDQTVDPGDTVLRIQHAFSGTDTFTSSNTDYAITFTREGFAYLGGNGLTITLHNTPYSAASVYYTRCLDITQAGMMSVQTNSSEASCQ